MIASLIKLKRPPGNGRPFIISLSRPEISLHIGGLFMDKIANKRRRRTRRDYTMGFKLKVVDAVEKGDMTYKQAQKVYGIQGRSTVLKWLRKHGKMDWTQPVRHVMPQSPKDKETPAQKIKRLERELEDERLRNMLMNEVVDILDAEYGAGLRKKYIAKERDAFKNRKG